MQQIKDIPLLFIAFTLVSFKNDTESNNINTLINEKKYSL